MSTPALAPAGRRRFWVTVALFALANVSFFVLYDRHFRPRTDLLRVDAFTPMDGSTIGQRQALFWKFNLDVAHSKDDPTPGTVSPQVSGKWSWRDARTLTFKPDDALPQATRFTFTLSPEHLRSEQGFHLDKPFVSTVQTEPLSLASATQIGFEGDDRAVLELRFNDNVLPADLLKALSINGPDGKPLRCGLYGEASGRIVRVVTDSIEAMHHTSGDMALKLRFAAGLAGTSGPLGLPADTEQSVPISTALFATELRANVPSHGDASLRLAFNNDFNLEQIRPLISVQPDVKFQLESGYRDVRIVGDFQPATRYSVTIAKSAAGSDPAKFPRGDTLSVFVPDSSPSVWFEHDEGYLGSRGNRSLLAHAVNLTDLRVSITRVYDNNLVAWRNADRRSGFRGDMLVDDFAKPIATKTLHLPNKKNQTQDLTISLDDLLPADARNDGAYRVTICAIDRKRADSDNDLTDEIEPGEQNASTLVTLSDLGVCAKSGRDGLHTWIVSLGDAKPMPGVRVRAFSDKNQLLGSTTTDENGLASIANLNPGPGESCAVLVADRGANDLTWLDLRSSQSTYSDADTSGRAWLRDGHEAFVFTERGVYRPGETVHLRAIVRGADLKTPAPFPVRWKILRPDLRNWNSTVTKLDDNGIATWDLPLPDDLVTGRWTARIGLPGDENFFGDVTFQVEEFMPDRLKASVTIADATESDSPARLRLSDQPISAHIQGDWLFGKPAAGLETHVVARLDPTTFAPASFPGWIFGDTANTADVLGDEKPLGRRSEIDAGELSENGSTVASLDVQKILTGTDSEETAEHPTRLSKIRKALTVAPTAQSSHRPYAGPWRLSVAATVLEPGGRGVTANAQANLDRVDCYIGLERPELPARPGETTRIPIALVTADGSRATGSRTLHAALYRDTWSNSLIFKDGRYHYDSSRKLDRVGDERSVKIENGQGEIPITPSTSGAYVLRVTDGNDGAVTSISFFVALGEWDDNISREDPEKLEISVVPAPKVDPANLFHPFTVGSPLEFSADAARVTVSRSSNTTSFPVDSLAQVLVRSPFAGRLLLTIETDSVVQSQVIDMPASHMLVPILIPRECRPNAYVSATVVRAIDPSASWRVHRALGVTRLSINNDDRKLNIAIDTPAEIRPERTLPVHVRVVDAANHPVANASVHVSAVDEGICQLTNFLTPDPFNFFYADRALGIQSADLYSQLMPEVQRPDRASAVGGDGDAEDGRHRSPVSAKRVRPVALINSVLRTNENGEVDASFPVPQFAGQLRISAVASAQDEFGNADAHTLVRSPLLVQSSWPRFVAPGDAFAVTLTAFNNGSTPGDVKIRATVLDESPHLHFAASSESRIELPTFAIRGGGQSTQVLNVVADRACGVAHVQLSATMGSENFNETVEIPIRPASPTITAGGFAFATPASAASVAIPTNFIAGTSQFEIRATPMPTLDLPQGLDYLERYPYGCAEQTTSTLFPLVYLSDIGEKIAPGVFAKDRVDEKVRAGIVRLLGMQTSDGGISMWPGERDAWPWVSVYAAHFMLQAENAGHSVPEDFRTHLLTYVRSLLNRSSDDSDELQTQAYACYVLALSGKPDRAAMDRIGELVAKSKSDATQARFHLASAWVAAGRRDRAAGLIPNVLPTMRASRQLSGNIDSAVRERAILLSTLLMVDPDRADLPALAQQLADAGKRGEWRSTQDTAFAVMALGQYLRQCKPAANYESAELVDGATKLVSVGAGETLAWKAPTTQPSHESAELKITGPADAKAYVSWLSNGVPTTAPSNVDNGVKLRRRFLDERGKTIETNTIHSGDLVQVALTLESPSTLDNIVIEDLLPAGFEIENPRLETSAKDTVNSAKPGIAIFQPARIDMRDDRMIIIGNLSPGTGQYTYTCRAVTPGTFVLPPARAECMYDLGTNSLFGAGTFTVTGNHDAPIANIGHD